MIDKSLARWIREIRRTIHRCPELGYQEFKTQSLIEQKLVELGVTDFQKIGGTGIRVDLHGDPGNGQVALRADMDALPIQEETDHSFVSEVDGIMHGCGHDGHVSMLLGAIALLQKKKFTGTVTCLFQPAEEHGNGAERLVQEGAIEGGISAIFAGHIDTHFPVGVITVDPGVICASSDPFTFRLKGHGGHAARPHEAKDALVAAAHLVVSLQTLISRETDPNKAGVVTVGRFHAGDAHNIIAGEAVVDGTVRATDPKVRRSILNGLKRIGDGISQQFGVCVDLSFHDGLPMVNNSPQAAETARASAIATVGEEMVLSQGQSSLGGEDFAFYQEHIPGCLVRFGGRGEVACGPAHSSTFDFDEKVLAIGAEWLADVACRALEEL